ncbi:MAG: helix-turn-helix transcriptional regulator, partial [Agathobacter sp.]|nr:helix-turn-helix transcriptional regulator [Agathobacter sp.]
MTLGEKIKFLRSKESITQEEFAEKLNVSRSAIAKWETDNGTPDIANLKMISQMFDISIDDLLNDEFGLSDSIIDEEETDTGCEVYEGYYWDIELKGWNDGVNDVLIIGEDEDFIFYRKKENPLYGVIGKRYITSIRRKEKLN